jgi:hypothetical protein
MVRPSKEFERLAWALDRQLMFAIRQMMGKADALAEAYRRGQDSAKEYRAMNKYADEAHALLTVYYAGGLITWDVYADLSIMEAAVGFH